MLDRSYVFRVTLVMLPTTVSTSRARYEPVECYALHFPAVGVFTNSIYLKSVLVVGDYTNNWKKHESSLRGFFVLNQGFIFKKKKGILYLLIPVKRNAFIRTLCVMLYDCDNLITLI